MKNFTYVKGIFALLMTAALWSTEASAQCQFPNPIPFYSQNFGTGARPAASTLTAYQVPELTYVGAGNMNAEKTYTITQTSNLHAPATDWHIITDHTGNPQGRMMLINDREPAGLTYRDRVASNVLGQGNVYYFNAYIMNILVPNRCVANGNNPNIFISLKVDILAGGVWTNLATSPTFTYPSSAAPQWQNIGVNFMTPLTQYDSARISINNESVVLCGNDYVLDDITVIGCTNNIILPVKLISFSGSLRNNVATLNWETAGETNFSHFEIERKEANSPYFSSIGTKPSANANGRATYQFGDDLTNVAGDAFSYRLKMIDLDGRTEYSRVVMVRKNQKAITGISINPSPIIAGTGGVVRFEALRNTKVTMRVMDMNGKTVLEQQNKVTEGTNSVSVNNLERLQAGTYVIQVLNGDELSTVKFTVVR